MRTYKYDFNESPFAEGEPYELILGSNEDVPDVGETVALDGRFDTAPIVEGTVEHTRPAGYGGGTVVSVRLDWDTRKYCDRCDGMGIGDGCPECGVSA